MSKTKLLYWIIGSIVVAVVVILAVVFRSEPENSNSNELYINEVEPRLIQGIEAVDDLNDVVYLSKTNQFLISSFDESKLYLLSPTTFGIEGEVPIEYPHKLLLSESLNELYVSVGGGKVIKLSAGSYAKLAEVTVGQRPSDMVFSSSQGYLYVVNEFSDTVSVIDVEDFSIVSTVGVGNRPVDIEINPGGNVYVANERDGSVSVISTETLTVIDTIYDVGRPTKLLSFPEQHLILLLDRFNSQLVVIDSDEQIVAKIDVIQFPIDMALDTKNRKLYVASFSDNSVGVVDLDLETMTEVIALGSAFETEGGLNNIVLTGDQSSLVITNTNIGEVYLVQLEN